MTLLTRPARTLTALVLSLQLAAPSVLAQPAEPEKKEAKSDEQAKAEKKAAKKDDKKAEKKAAKKDDKKSKKDEPGKEGGDEAKPAEAAPEAPAIPPLSESLTGMAKAEYEAGKVLFVDGDYAGAKLKFERVYELSQDARVLWNVAAAEKNLRHYAKTLAALRRYLDQGGDKLTEQDKADAKQLIDAMTAFVADLTIDVDQPDAEIRIDDEVVGRSPLPAPVSLDQGNHHVRVDKDGFKPYAAVHTVTGGEPAKIDVKLVAVVHEGRLRVVAGVGDSISIDGKVVGKGTWEGTLPSGTHTVAVTASGKRAYQTDVVVSDDQTTTQRVALESERKEEPAGFMAGPWPWVIGGAVLVAGAGVGAYFLFRPEDEGPPAPVPGSLGTADLPLHARGFRGAHVRF